MLASIQLDATLASIKQEARHDGALAERMAHWTAVFRERGEQRPEDDSQFAAASAGATCDAVLGACSASAYALRTVLYLSPACSWFAHRCWLRCATCRSRIFDATTEQCYCKVQHHAPTPAAIIPLCPVRVLLPGAELAEAIASWQTRHHLAAVLSTGFLDGSHPIVDAYELGVRLQHMLRRLAALAAGAMVQAPTCVLPGLWLGNAVAADSHHLLQYLGVTHVVNAAQVGQVGITLRVFGAAAHSRTSCAGFLCQLMGAMDWTSQPGWPILLAGRRTAYAPASSLPNCLACCCACDANPLLLPPLTLYCCCGCLALRACMLLKQELQCESAPGLFQVHRVAIRDEEEEDVAAHFMQVRLHASLLLLRFSVVCRLLWLQLKLLCADQLQCVSLRLFKLKHMMRCNVFVCGLAAMRNMRSCNMQLTTSPTSPATPALPLCRLLLLCGGGAMCVCRCRPGSTLRCVAAAQCWCTATRARAAAWRCCWATSC